MSSATDVVRGRWRLGAIPTPRCKLLAAIPFRPHAAAPRQIVWLADRYDPWGNDQYGDCVSAEEAWAKAVFGTKPFIPADTVIQWARQGGFLNGAMLDEVMDAMAKRGLAVGAQTYNDGPYKGVDYSNESVLQAALAVGPVKIGIDHSALPQGAGNQQGWVGVGGRPGQYRNTDHCVGLGGFGPAGWLFEQLKLPLPAQLQPTQPGYLLYTWATVGFVDHAWIMSTCSEAWIRQPTTVGVPPLPDPTPTPTPPGPTPTPTPSPTPNWWADILYYAMQVLPMIIEWLLKNRAAVAKACRAVADQLDSRPDSSTQGSPGYQPGHASQPPPSQGGQSSGGA